MLDIRNHTWLSYYESALSQQYYNYIPKSTIRNSFNGCNRRIVIGATAFGYLLFFGVLCIRYYINRRNQSTKYKKKPRVHIEFHKIAKYVTAASAIYAITASPTIHKQKNLTYQFRMPYTKFKSPNDYSS